ncbi:hypothetical protein FA13DRAFT_1080437 [Coprinellus micaceus]|uniref:Uncharacterized protein n=1 Tax=Coprinellus micaceus TaxID=71717 RepID=A0A4Y7TRD5_COPMI|nr:hypothetical protein FA13DRAFT_1080437 [Coprinellus micaceus]
MRFEGEIPHIQGFRLQSEYICCGLHLSLELYVSRCDARAIGIAATFHNQPSSLPLPTTRSPADVGPWLGRGRNCDYFREKQ